MQNSSVKAICFYLPQFHPVPENDDWWGEGFTEWRNVTKARPLFHGHYQPHLPADLGFYDLRVPEVRDAQAELARNHGIHGFCYYHYWFNGRRILERPFNEVLASGKPDFPFCLCWANENWTRVWDGGDRHILLEQRYSTDDDLEHIQSLIPAFRDERYIRVNNKPIFLIYRAELLPDPIATTTRWREAAAKAGIGDLYLARVESYDSVRQKIAAPLLGFDADVEFSPFSWNLGNVKFRGRLYNALAATRLLPKECIENNIIDYDCMINGMLNRPDVEWPRFRCVSPSWDNSARKKNAFIFHGSTPEKYENWLRHVVARTAEKNDGTERLIFINAWNEWAEGNHLEPDQKWGHAYLEATRRALQGAIMPPPDSAEQDPSTPSAIKRLYWDAVAFFKGQLDLLKYIGR